MTARSSWRLTLWACACLGLAAGCETTHTEEPAGLSNARARQLSPRRAWQLVEFGNVRGELVQFVAPADGAQPEAHYYSVRNLRQQELGLIDAQGRAWRYEVHQREAHWLTTGTLLDCARAILGGGTSAQLVEQPLAHSVAD